MSDYLVDITMPVYNHGRFLRQAIEGVVNQKTDFRFRLIIGEDCSTDNSREIIQEYAERYPEIIVPYYHEKNIGAVPNGAFLTGKLDAKYIAICEGDDYWIDDNKLQMQVEFLESHPDFSYAFTDVYILNEMRGDKQPVYEPDYYPAPDRDVILFEDFLYSHRNIAATPTIVFRNILPRPLPEFFYKTLSIDLFMQLYLADKGKAMHFCKKTAVYRDHSGGISKSADSMEKGERQLVNLYNYLDEYFGGKYHKQFRRKLFEMTKVKLIYGARDKKGTDKWKHYREQMPQYLKYSDKINVKELLYYHMVLFFPSILKAVARKSR